MAMEFSHGAKVVQIVMYWYETPEVQEVVSLSKTECSDHGFGSTVIEGCDMHVSAVISVTPHSLNIPKHSYQGNKSLEAIQRQLDALLPSSSSAKQMYAKY
ncbi:hypothetical protein H4S07_004654 [Coemansia furcata]|uniref:Uncharacterized protein n=1 Tax=Coemansia furcata TaxID=417177 RepID=A0ACC1L832_9FUNG|nr:hypothetical protein H4S07_004654 [Coemansia furcata]